MVIVRDRVVGRSSVTGKDLRRGVVVTFSGRCDESPVAGVYLR